MKKVLYTVVALASVMLVAPASVCATAAARLEERTGCAISAAFGMALRGVRRRAGAVALGVRGHAKAWRAIQARPGSIRAGHDLRPSSFIETLALLRCVIISRRFNNTENS